MYISKNDWPCKCRLIIDVIHVARGDSVLLFYLLWIDCRFAVELGILRPPIKSLSAGWWFATTRKYSSVADDSATPQKNLSSFWWYHSLNFQCPSYLAVIQFLSKWRQKVAEVCNFRSPVWNFTTPSRRYASPCGVFQIKAKLTHKDMYLIGNFLIFYMVLFSLHSTHGY